MSRLYAQRQAATPGTTSGDHQLPFGVGEQVLSSDPGKPRLSNLQPPSRNICFAMPPPLLLLQDIGLTFGATPLLSDAGLTVEAGDRVCLVGRTARQVHLAAHCGRTGAARCGGSLRPARSLIHYLPQELDLAGFVTTLAYVEAGFDAEAADGRHRALYLLKETRPLGPWKSPPPCPAVGHDALRWPARWPPCPISCCSTSRPIILIFPVSSGWSASWPRCAPASC